MPVEISLRLASASKLSSSSSGRTWRFCLTFSLKGEERCQHLMHFNAVSGCLGVLCCVPGTVTHFLCLTRGVCLAGAGAIAQLARLSFGWSPVDVTCALRWQAARGDRAVRVIGCRNGRRIAASKSPLSLPDPKSRSVRWTEMAKMACEAVMTARRRSSSDP